MKVNSLTMTGCFAAAVARLASEQGAGFSVRGVSSVRHPEPGGVLGGRARDVKPLSDKMQEYRRHEKGSFPVYVATTTTQVSDSASDAPSGGSVSHEAASEQTVQGAQESPPVAPESAQETTRGEPVPDEPLQLHPVFEQLRDMYGRLEADGFNMDSLELEYFFSDYTLSDDIRAPLVHKYGEPAVADMEALALSASDTLRTCLTPDDFRKTVAVFQRDADNTESSSPAIVHLHWLPDGPEKDKQLKVLEEKVGEKRKAGYLPLVPRNGQRHLQNGNNGEVSLVMPGYSGKTGVCKQPAVNPKTGRVREMTVNAIVAETGFLKKLSHENIVRKLPDFCREEGESNRTGSGGTHLFTQYAGGELLGLIEMQYDTSTGCDPNQMRHDKYIYDIGEFPSFNPLPVKLIQSILRQLCSALGYLHKQGIVHRNVKTRNILITPDGKVSLCDFGSALEYLLFEENEKWSPNYDSWRLGETLYDLAFGGQGRQWEADMLKFHVKENTLASFLDKEIKRISDACPGEWLTQQQATDLKHLMVGLLAIPPQTRITMEDALKHPFLRDAPDSGQPEALEQVAARRSQPATPAAGAPSGRRCGTKAKPGA